MIDYTKKPKATTASTGSVKLRKGETINLTQTVARMAGAK